MSRKRLCLILAVGALLLLQFADCMAAFSQDQQAMQCCGTSTCTPANQSRCCKTMNSTETPMMVLTAGASLDMPAVVVERTPVLDTAMLTSLKSTEFEEVQLYSPPELYTLHSSLLI